MEINSFILVWKVYSLGNQPEQLKVILKKQQQKASS